MHRPPLPTLWKTLFWTLVLITLWLSLVPVEQVPSAFHFWDKAQHALGFAGLALLGLMAYPKHIHRLLLGLMLLGAFIEVAQWLTGWRQGDWQDWVADCMGLMISSAFWRFVAILRKQQF
jgi:VanZ family protein